MSGMSIDSLRQSSDPYTVTAALDGGQLQTTDVSGDRTTDAFTDAAQDTMGKMDFLTLLTTQLKYQDPMEPQDNTEFVAQLAQFSQLETMSNVGVSMEGLEKSFTDSLGIQSNSAQSMTNASAVSLIGKEVRLRQNSFEWSGSGEMEFQVHMGERESVSVEIFDSETETIKTFEITQKDLTNAGTFVWDGNDELGQPVMPGNYGLYVHGQDEDPSLYCFLEDKVSGVRYEATGPVVKVAGKEMPVGNILEVNTVAAGDPSYDTLDLTMSQALGLVGKGIKYSDHGTSFAPSLGGTKTMNVDLAGTPQATVVVRDDNGVVAHQYTVKNEGDGVAKLNIPMDDKNGTGGVYTVEIINNPNAYFYKQGDISGVMPSGTGIKLKVDGMQISAHEILEVSG